MCRGQVQVDPDPGGPGGAYPGRICPLRPCAASPRSRRAAVAQGWKPSASVKSKAPPLRVELPAAFLLFLRHATGGSGCRCRRWRPGLAREANWQRLLQRALIP